MNNNPYNSSVDYVDRAFGDTKKRGAVEVNDAGTFEQYIKAITYISELVQETKNEVNEINYNLFGPILALANGEVQATKPPGRVEMLHSAIGELTEDVKELRSSIRKLAQL